MGELSKIVSHLEEFEEQEKERKRAIREERELERKLKLEEKINEIIGDDSVSDDDEIEGEEDNGEHSRCMVIKNYDVPKFDLKEPDPNVKGAETKFKRRMGQYLAFIDCVKYYRSSKYCSILDLACTSRRFQEIFGTYKSVSNAFQRLEEIGLIKEFDNRYYTGMSKSYYYYIENEKELVDYCKKHNIQKMIIKNVFTLSKKEKETVNLHQKTSVKKGLQNKVLFKSKLKLARPKNIKPGAFKLVLLDYLYKNYPGLKIYQTIADVINEKYYKDDDNLRIKFKPKFHWNEPKKDKNKKVIKGTNMKSVVGISIRVANHYCNAKKDNYVTKEEKRKTRDQVRAEYGFNFEKDITSSVPRITYMLNGGGWLKDEVDLYKKIYDAYKPGGTDFDKERDAIKKLFFRAYFDSTDEKLGKNTWDKMTHDGMDEKEVCADMVKLRRAMEQALGKTRYGNEVFFAESCIYIDALSMLLAKGYKVWLVFDCFYGTGFGTQEEFEEYVLDAVYIAFVRFKTAWDFGDWDNIVSI